MKRILTYIIVAIFVLGLGGLGVYLYTDFMGKDEEVVPYLSKEFKMTDIKSVSSVVKDFSYANNTALESNIKEWNIDSVEYIGYYEDDKDIKYYHVTGSYLCNDDSNKCIISNSKDIVNDKYIYSVIGAFRELDSYYVLDNVIKELSNVNNIITDKYDGIRNTGYSMEELVNLYKDYMISNNFVIKRDVSNWDVKLFYVGMDSDYLVFNVSNTFSCSTMGNLCIYVNDISNGTNGFEVSIKLKKDNDGTYKIFSLSNKLNDNLEVSGLEEDIINKSVSRDIFNTLLERFYYDNGMANKDAVKAFDMTYLTFKGEYKNRLGYFVLSASMTFECVEGVYSCVNTSIKRDPNLKTYTEQIMFEVLLDETGNYKVTNVFDVMDDSLLILKKIIV